MLGGLRFQEDFFESLTLGSVFIDGFLYGSAQSLFQIFQDLQLFLDGVFIPLFGFVEVWRRRRRLLKEGTCLCKGSELSTRVKRSPPL